MKQKLAVVIIGVAIACGSTALAEMIGTHKVFLPQDIKWGSDAPFATGRGGGGGAVWRPGQGRHVRASDQGAERVSHRSAYAP